MSDDPIKSAAEGVAKAAIEWTEEKIRDAVKQFLNRKLAFIKDADNIELVKRQKQSSEYELITQYLPKGEYSTQIMMGLALREVKNEEDRVLDFGEKIKRRYGKPGLHRAEITEIGITSQLISRLVELYPTKAEVIKKLVYFLDHSEELVIFVRTNNDPMTITRLVLTRIETLSSHMMILFGSGYAKDVLLQVLREVKENPRGYVIDAREERFQLTAFIYTPELKSNITHWSDPLNR